VRKRLGTAGPVGAESAHGVPYLKRQRTRLITGYILVRGQGEPPENEGRMLNLLFFPVSRNDRFQMEASGTSTTGPFASLPKDFSYPFWDFSMIQITFWTDESSVEDTIFDMIVTGYRFNLASNMKSFADHKYSVSIRVSQGTDNGGKPGVIIGDGYNIGLFGVKENDGTNSLDVEFEWNAPGTKHVIVTCIKF
jgi:hypothetical protein